MSSGDVCWVLVSAALVLLMVFGLALFYGGMVRRKNVLSTFMHSFAALPLVSMQWMLVGYTLVFGHSRGGVIGGLEHAGLSGLVGETAAWCMPPRGSRHWWWPRCWGRACAIRKNGRFRTISP